MAAVRGKVIESGLLRARCIVSTRRRTPTNLVIHGGEDAACGLVGAEDVVGDDSAALDGVLSGDGKDLHSDLDLSVPEVVGFKKGVVPGVEGVGLGVTDVEAVEARVNF